MSAVSRGWLHSLGRSLGNTAICFSSVLRLGTLGSPASGEHVTRALERGPEVLGSIPTAAAAFSYDPG